MVRTLINMFDIMKKCTMIMKWADGTIDNRYCSTSIYVTYTRAYAIVP